MKVYNLHALKTMEMTRECISFTFDPRGMLFSLQIGFSFVRAVVACAILERLSGLVPSSETTAHRYLKLVTVQYSLSFYLYFSPDAIGALCHQFCLLSSDFHLYTLCRCFENSTRSSNSCFSLGKASTAYW